MDFLARCEEAGVDAFVEAMHKEEDNWRRKCENAREVYEVALQQWSESERVNGF